MVLWYENEAKHQVAIHEANTYAYYTDFALLSISVSWMMLFDKAQFVHASLTAESTIRTKLLWNKVCDKKNNKNIKKMNKLRFCYLLVL